MATNLENFTLIASGLYNTATPTNAQLTKLGDAILRAIGEETLILEYGVGRAGMTTAQRAQACMKWERHRHRLLIGNDAELTVKEAVEGDAEAARVAALADMGG